METPMSDQSAQINPLIVNIQKTLIELIEFTKRRQWAITNYTVLIYVGIFGVAHSFGTTIRTGEKVALTLLALLAWGCAIWLLIQIQGDAGRYRARLEVVHNKWLSEEEREVAGIKPYVNPALRGVQFLAALVGVVTIGAGIVIYSVLRH